MTFLKVYQTPLRRKYLPYQASVAKWLRSLTGYHLPATAAGLSPVGVGLFHVTKLTEGWWFY